MCIIRVIFVIFFCSFSVIVQANDCDNFKKSKKDFEKNIKKSAFVEAIGNLYSMVILVSLCDENWVLDELKSAIADLKKNSKKLYATIEAQQIFLNAKQQELNKNTSELAQARLQLQNDSVRIYESNKRAEEGRKTADSLRAVAIEANKANQRFIRSMEFYDDENQRFALALKDGKYGFIDANATVLLGDDGNGGFEYTKAEPFDKELGFAYVRIKDKDYYIDTLGNKYLLARSMSDFNVNTEALDLSGQNLAEVPKKIFSTGLNKMLKVLILRDNNLKVLPFFYDKTPNLKVLVLNRNKIVDIRSNMFPKNLERLLWENNPITVQSFQYLSNLSQLKELDLSGGSIESLPDSCFRKMPDLRKLKLNNTNIKNISPAAFAGLSRLRYLNLSNNNINALPDSIFYAMPSLEILELAAINRNKATIRPQSFDTLQHLLRLNLSGNQLDSIDARMLVALKKLQWLDLSGNNLQGINDSIFIYNAHIKTLKLTNANLTVLSEKILLPLLELEDLELSGNAFKNFNNRPFTTQKALFSLSIDQNKEPLLLDSISWKDLSGLVELSLNKTPLSKLQPTSFQGLTSLRVLHINECQIKELPSTVFVPLGKLQSLSLKKNQLTTLPDTVFYPLQNLLYLQLDSNDIRYPSACIFCKLEKLKKLSIEGCHITKPLDFSAQKASLIELNLNNSGYRVSIENIKFEDLEQLRILHFSNCELKDCPELKLPRLRELDLSGNHFSEVKNLRLFLPDLEVLDLSGTRITRIADYAFNNCKNIGLLDLRGTNIKADDVSGVESKNAVHRNKLQSLSTLRLPKNLEAEKKAISKSVLETCNIEYE